MMIEIEVDEPELEGAREVQWRCLVCGERQRTLGGIPPLRACDSGDPHRWTIDRR